MKEDEGTFDLAMYYEHECKVKGKDFTAHVTMDGRILTSRAPGEWHAFGVNPGGIAVKTKKQGEMKQAFTREVELVLEDIALENNYEDFTRKAHKLFHTSGKKAQIGRAHV